MARAGSTTEIGNSPQHSAHAVAGFFHRPVRRRDKSAISLHRHRALPALRQSRPPTHIFSADHRPLHRRLRPLSRPIATRTSSLRPTLGADQCGRENGEKQEKSHSHKGATKPAFGKWHEAGLSLARRQFLRCWKRNLRGCSGKKLPENPKISPPADSESPPAKNESLQTKSAAMSGRKISLCGGKDSLWEREISIFFAKFQYWEKNFDVGRR